MAPTRSRPSPRLRVLAVFALLAPPLLAQYPSDTCTSAPPIIPNANAAYHVASTTETRDGSSSCDPATSGNDVWWSYTPTTNGRARLSAWPSSAPHHDVHLSVHTGCPGTPANEVVCNDDYEFSLDGFPQVEFEAQAGATYYLRFADLGNQSSNFFVRLQFPVDRPPRNDDPAHAATVVPGVRVFEGSGADPLDPLSCWGGGGAVWFRYLPVASGIASVNLCTYSPLPTALDDTGLSVHEGTTLLVCSDDSCMYLSSGTWSAIAGREYLIRVFDFWGAGGSFTLDLDGPPSRTDGCGQTPLLELGEQLLLLSGSSADGSSSCDGGTEPDMLFAFVAPTLGVLDVSTCGTDDDQGIDSGEDSLISIHSACPGSAADELACSDDAACALDQGQLVDAHADVALAAGSRVFVRVSRKGPPSIAPIRLTTQFRPGVAFCAGDGSATTCPCGNGGTIAAGCGNSANPSGAALVAEGSPEVADDTLTLRTSGLPATSITLFIQGTQQQSGGSGVVFGDGLRCAGGSVARLGVRTASGGSASFGAEDGMSTSVAAAGALPPGGGLRHYQNWYRDAAPFCTSQTFNLSNGLSIIWEP